MKCRTCEIDLPESEFRTREDKDCHKCIKQKILESVRKWRLTHREEEKIKDRDRKRKIYALRPKKRERKSDKTFDRYIGLISKCI